MRDDHHDPNRPRSTPETPKRGRNEIDPEEQDERSSGEPEAVDTHIDSKECVDPQVETYRKAREQADSNKTPDDQQDDQSPGR